jgi:protein phosphatase
VATPSERSDTSWAASVWAPLREQIAAAPPLQAEGRPAGEGRLIGAAARTTPLTLAALGEPEPDGGEAATGPLAPRHRLPRGPSGAPPAVDSEGEEAPEAEAERARYSPTERKGVRPGVLALVGAIVLVIGLALGGLVLYGRSQYFVGAADGVVTIFRGLPGDIAGVSTHGVVERADIALVDLPTAWREKLEKGIEQSGLDAARAEVAGLRQIRASCLDERDARVAWEQAQASPTPSPTGTSTSSAAPTSASTGSASPTSATTRSPGATATSSTAPGPSPNPTAVPNPTTPTATATPSPTGPPSPPPTWTDGC